MNEHKIPDLQFTCKLITSLQGKIFFHSLIIVIFQSLRRWNNQERTNKDSKKNNFLIEAYHLLYKMIRESKNSFHRPAMI